MASRFEKILWQMAQAENDLEEDRTALRSQAQNVRRLEELIRAKEATGDRIAIGIAAVLVVSATGLPVYAALYGNGYGSTPAIGSALSSSTSVAAGRLRPVAPAASAIAEDTVTEVGSIAKTEPRRRPVQQTETSRGEYVVHSASGSAALIEGPSGVWWVKPGMTVPGAGQILAIEHTDAGWVVVTSETTITEASVSGS